MVSQYDFGRMPFVHSYIYSTACGIVFCRIEEIVENTDITERSIEDSEAVERLERSMHGPKPLVEELGVDDMLRNIRKFRRIRLINRSIGHDTYVPLLRGSSVVGILGDEDEDWDEDEDEEALEDVFEISQDKPTVPVLIEWEGNGEHVYVTGTFAGWNRKFRLHEK